MTDRFRRFRYAMGCVFDWCRHHIYWTRYGWLMIVSPLLIILAARWSPSLMTGLLLMRAESTMQLMLDLFFLSAISGAAVAFGIAQLRIVDLYGKLRLDRGADTKLELHQPSEKRRIDWFWWAQDSSAWPALVILIWILASTVYPLESFLETMETRVGELQIADWQFNALAFLAIFLGLAATMLALLFVSLVQLAFNRRAASACGALPMEDVAAWILDRLFGKPSETDDKNNWCWWWISPGFTYPGRQDILPGHFQLAFLFLFAVTGYGFLFWKSYRVAAWPPQLFPVGFYALLLLASVGGLAGWLAYFLGRWRIPLWAPLLLYIVVGQLFGHMLPIDSHHYFALISKSTPASVQTLIDAIPPKEKHPFVAAMKSRPREIKDYPPRQKLHEIYADWAFPVGPDNKKTMIVITASGGGIQAAAWTARVLTGLESRIPSFRRSIGLISCVSGGSVGTMYYLRHPGQNGSDENGVDGANDPQKLQLRLQEIQNELRQGAYASSLEAVSWGLVFPDLAKTILPFRIWDKEIDRGWSLESTWWNRIGRNASDSALMQELRIRDLIQPTNDHKIPPVVFNATAVETGQRVMISPVMTCDDASQSPNHYEVLTSPIDLLDYYEHLFNEPNQINPRLTTAVRLSSSFAYVTPVALPLIEEENRADMIKPGVPQRLNLHLCDGGYSDNTGLVAAIRLISELLTHYKKQQEKPPFDRIVIFSIEPFAETPVVVQSNSSGLLSGILGPGLALTNARVSTQAERALLEQNLLVLANTSGLNDLSQQQVIDLLPGIATSFNEWKSDAEDFSEKTKDASSDSRLQDLRNNLLQEKPDMSPLDMSHLPAFSREILAKNKLRSVKEHLDQKPLTQALDEDFERTCEAAQEISPEAVASLRKLRDSYHRVHENLAKAGPIDTRRPDAHVETSHGMANPTPSAAFDLGVDITSISFRFNPDAEYRPANVSEKAKVPSKPTAPVPSPPLSWVLSPWDQARIDTAWQIKESWLVHGPDNASPPDTSGPTVGAGSADEEKAPKGDPLKTGTVLAPLRNSTLSPESFNNMFSVRKE